MNEKTKTRIWAIGGANIDLNGVPEKPLIPEDSNIGNISFSYGGVARNIAEAAALSGSNVSLVSCFSEDFFGTALSKDCMDLGIDLSSSIFTKDYHTSIYIALMDFDGDLSLGMSDMKILECLNIDSISSVLDKIKPGDILVIDANLNDEIISYITRNTEATIAVDPVSVNKISKLKKYLSSISIFKLNKIEAEALTGISIQDHISAKKSINWFIDNGVSEIIITLSGDGIYYGTKEKCFFVSFDKVDAKVPTGAGDAFFGGYLSVKAEGGSLEMAIKRAISVASLRLLHQNNKFKTINLDLINDYLDKITISKEDI